MNGLSVLKRPAARCTDPLHIVNPPAARRTDPLHNVKRPAARCIEALDHRISGKIFRTDPPPQRRLVFTTKAPSTQRGGRPSCSSW